MKFLGSLLFLCLCILAAWTASAGDVPGSDAVRIQSKQDDSGQEQLILGIFPPVCYTKLFVTGDFMDVKCLQLVVSKLLGYALITGAVFLKAPQIMKIVASKDVTGLAPASFYLETLGMLSTMLYNVRRGLPWSTYGETLIITVQNLLLVLLFWRYSQRSTAEMVSTSVFGVLYANFVMFLASEDILPVLPALSVVIFIAARLPQIVANHTNGHTGQLALVTQLLMVGGNLARIFTTLTEVDDMMILGSFLISTVLNTLLLVQIFWYWDATEKAMSRATRGKSRPKSTRPNTRKSQKVD